MCGRAFETFTKIDLSRRYYLSHQIDEFSELTPTYNLAPSQVAPVIRVVDGKRRVDLFRWGLVPLWVADLKTASQYSLINAKGEEIEQKKSYRGPFENQRCIVPLSGFIEWKREERGPKRPFRIELKTGDIMSVAGVWERWVSPETGEEIFSFSIITTGSNSFMTEIHHRMPVILDEADEEAWLDPANRDLMGLKKMLKPCPSEWLKACEISSAINSPQNNYKEVLDAAPLDGFSDLPLFR